MQPVNTSTAAGGSNETLGIVGSSHGTLERENNSHDLHPEGDSLNVLQPNLEEDVSGESLLANKKLRAACWKDFELTMLADGTCKALCKHCKKDLVAGNRAGTSHFNYHIKVCPKNQSSKRRKFGSPSVEIPVFDQQRSRDDFARMVLAHGYSFNMAEHYYTRTFLCNLQPSFKLVHRTSLKDDCMKIYDEEKLRVYQIFDKQQSRFSITSDMWTHTEMSGYMSITAHYIDDEWNLHKRLIGFAHVEIPHTGEHIAKEIISRLYPWNLDRRLFSLALDNCTVNNVVIQDVKKFLLSKKVLHLDGSLFHIRCASHVLNLIVQDGLAVISSAIGKIRESVKYVNGSTLRKEKFKLLAQQVNAPNLSLKSDTPTRWNSTFLMLERAMKFRAAFDRLHECDGSYKFVPSEEDWQHIECVSDCLKVFYDVTKRVSGTKYPTLSLYFNDFSGIYLLLREWKFSANAFVASMAVPMVEKFEKYWDNANKLLEIATILDPRYKMKSIEYYYGLLYDSFVAELRVESARKSFSELFGEYARQPSRISSQASTTRNFEVEVASSTEPSSSLVATRLGLEKFIYESNSSQHSKSDLEVYLEDPAVEESGYHAVLKLPKSFESNRCKYIPTDGRSSWTSTYASSGGRTVPAATTLRRRSAASCRAGTRGPSGQARMGPGSRRELRVGGAGLRRGLAAGAWCSELAGGVGVAS